MIKKAVMIILVVVMLATFAGTAIAGPPTHLNWEEPLYEVLDCGDYEVIIDLWATVSLTLFADDNNNPNAYHIQALFTGDVTNTATGSVFVGHGVLSGQNPLSGGRIRQGMYYHITKPGEGLLALAAGHIVLDMNGDVEQVAGPGMFELFEDPGEAAWLCEALEGH